MRDKSVKELPGIGDVLGDRLIRLGYDKAYILLGQYVYLKNERKFKKWLHLACNANAKQQGDCYRGLEAWMKVYYRYMTEQ